jgi:hypothetical protein
MALAVVVGCTACASKTFDHKKAVKFCEEEGYEMYDDAEDYADAFNEIIIGDRPGDRAYIHAVKDGAQDVYDSVFNRFEAYPECDVNEATSFIFFDDDVFVQGYVLTFDDAKGAEKVYKSYARHMKDYGETGEDKGYSYFIMERKYSDNLKQYCGFYQKNNSVLFVQCNYKKPTMVDEICENFGVISPSEA